MNNIGDIGAQAMADAVAHDNCRLTSIDLDCELKWMFSTPSSKNHVVPKDLIPALKIHLTPYTKWPDTVLMSAPAHPLITIRLYN